VVAAEEAEELPVLLQLVKVFLLFTIAEVAVAEEPVLL
jgi:hypothetical protein